MYVTVLVQMEMALVHLVMELEYYRSIRYEKVFNRIGDVIIRGGITP